MNDILRAASDGTSSEACFSPQEYWQNRLTTDFSVIGVGYSLLGREYNKWQYKLRSRVLDRTLAGLHSDLTYANVLDVGSGTGFYIDYWRHAGVRSVSGCDLTDISISRLREQYPDISFRQLDIGADLPADYSAQFDVVSAFDILFHIVDSTRYEMAFRNIARLLVPGGLFCFSEIFPHQGTQRGYHVVFHSLSHIEKMLADSGFTILCRRPAFVLMNEPLDTRSAVAKTLWKAMMYPVRKSEMLGWLWGATLFSADLFLTKLIDESPTTEIVVCQKMG
jgi:SAM-dependent methyltransferase